jgi:hypothetical protein
MKDRPGLAGGNVGMAWFFIDTAMLVAQLVYGNQATFRQRGLRTAGYNQAKQLPAQLGERHRKVFKGSRPSLDRTPPHGDLAYGMSEDAAKIDAAPNETISSATTLRVHQHSDELDIGAARIRIVILSLLITAT